MRHIIIIFCLSLVVFSCKNPKKEKTPTNEDSTEKESNIKIQEDLTNTLRVYIDGVIKNDVQPKIIYTDGFATDAVVANKIVGRPK